MNAPREIHVETSGVDKFFGDFRALAEITFQVGQAEFVTILGPSGCGKTTILRIIAGLENQTSGRVLIGGRDVSGWPVAKRNVGIVFQNYALFPNLKVSENVTYGLRNKRSRKVAVAARLKELLDLVGLGGQEEKYPAQLSGGQQQRVALARALALKPGLLLLDEPLSALDAKVRVRLRAEIRALQQRLGVTTIMVTHDQEEALTMADRVLVMDQGRLVQFAPPNEIYDRPATPFVASFIGSMNFLRGATIRGREELELGGTRLLSRAIPTTTGDRSALVAIRPEDVMLQPNGDRSPNLFRATIRETEYRGSHYRVKCDLAISGDRGWGLEAELPAEKFHRLGLTDGLRVKVDLPPEKLIVYPDQAPNRADRG